MKPVQFDGVNVVIGKDQEEYQDLPAQIVGEKVITCWELSDQEVEEIVKSKKIWLGVLTFGMPFQPCLLTTSKEDL